MVKIEASTQGVDNGFKYTGSYDSIEFGEVTVAKAKELMRELPDLGGVSQWYLEGNEDLCPPALHLTFNKIVKRVFLEGGRWRNRLACPCAEVIKREELTYRNHSDTFRKI